MRDRHRDRDLREEDADRAIDLILAILDIETNPVLLSMLAGAAWWWLQRPLSLAPLLSAPRRP